MSIVFSFFFVGHPFFILFFFYKHKVLTIILGQLNQDIVRVSKINFEQLFLLVWSVVQNLSIKFHLILKVILGVNVFQRV